MRTDSENLKKRLERKKNLIPGNDISWQFKVHYYFDKKSGKRRKHRKRVYDLCNCGRRKRVGSKMCRHCYETDEHRAKKHAMELVKLLDEITESCQLPDELKHRADKLLSEIRANHNQPGKPPFERQRI